MHAFPCTASEMVPAHHAKPGDGVRPHCIALTSAPSIDSVCAPGSGQTAKQVLMVAPTAFTFNDQAAADNRFMHSSAAASSGTDVAARVLAEHNGLQEKLANVSNLGALDPVLVVGLRRAWDWDIRRDHCAVLGSRQ